MKKKTHENGLFAQVSVINWRMNAYDSNVWCHSAHQSINRLKKRMLFPEKTDISRV